jgi:hypothetical protein
MGFTYGMQVRILDASAFETAKDDVHSYIQHVMLIHVCMRGRRSQARIGHC